MRSRTFLVAAAAFLTFGFTDCPSDSDLDADEGLICTLKLCGDFLEVILSPPLSGPGDYSFAFEHEETNYVTTISLPNSEDGNEISSVRSSIPVAGTTLRVLLDGELLGEETIDPHYWREYPNGKACDCPEEGRDCTYCLKGQVTVLTSDWR